MADKNTGDTYGGSGWQALLAQQVQAAVQAALERMNMSGYMQPEGPSRMDTLKAIFENRPDLKASYASDTSKGKKGKKSKFEGDWYSWMEDWIGKTKEGAVKTDPTAYAQSQGWLPKEGTGQTPTLGREQMQNQYGLGYLQLLAQQRGPQDWVSYWNTVRGAQGSNLPAWASAIAGNQQVAPFQGAARANQPFAGFQGLPGKEPGASPGIGMPSTPGTPYTPPGTTYNKPVAQTTAAQAALQRLTGAVANQQQVQGVPRWYTNLPQLNPLRAQPGQLSNLLPSELAGLQGLIESQGGNYQDWMTQAQRAWPTGRASARNVWS